MNARRLGLYTLLLGLAPSALAVASEPPASAAQAVPDRVERDLEALDREQKTKEKELAALGVRAKELHARSVARGRSYVKLARAGLLPVGGGFEALVSHAARIERARRGLERDVAEERRVVERRLALGKELEALRAQRAPLELQRRALSEARDALLARQDRALAFERAFSHGESGHAAVYGAAPGALDAVEARSGFAALRGRAPFPLPGRAEITPARRAASDAPGLEMRAAAGAAVRAIAAGRVAFADTYADYGKTVILDHGGQHFTVTANLAEIGVAVGDELASGARLGSVGALGRGWGIYFELRVGGETVDPAPWFGL